MFIYSFIYHRDQPYFINFVLMQEEEIGWITSIQPNVVYPMLIDKKYRLFSSAFSSSESLEMG